MAYTRWWHSILIGFSVCVWGLSQPLYSFIIENHRLEGAAGSGIVLFMLIYQGFPMAALVLIDRVLAPKWGLGIARRPFRIVLFVGAAFVFLRVLQMGGNLPLYGVVESWPVELSVGVVLVFLAVIAVAIVYFFRPITLLFIYLSVPSVILTGLFITQVGLFGEAWRDRSPERQTPRNLTDAGQIPVFILVFDGLGNDILFKDGKIDPSRFGR